MEVRNITQICQDFVTYLRNKGIFKEKWERSTLREEYQVFKRNREDIRVCFSDWSYRAARRRPAVLKRRRETITFQNVPPWLVICPVDNLPKPSRRLSNGRRNTRQRCTIVSNVSPTLGAQYNSDLENQRSRLNGVERSGQKTNKPFLGSPIISDDDRRLPLAAVSLNVVKSPKPVESALNVTQPSRRPSQALLYNSDPNGSAKTSHQYAGTENPPKDDVKRDFKAKKAAEVTAKKMIGGVRPSFLTGGEKIVLPLPDFKIPLDVEISHRHGHLKNDTLLSQRLSRENYVDKFHLLLYIEEIQYRTEILSYSMDSTILQRKQRGNLLHLEVPGLAENRPSLLIGDRVYAAKLDAKGQQYDGYEYEGFVHSVEQQQVGLGFNRKLVDIFQKNMKFSVRFTFNRRPLRLMHRALDLVESNRLTEMLFPTSFPKPYSPKMKLVMRKREIESNLEQRTAVENIVLGKTPPIYIIFGPPGTGKTVTMVEAIYQTHKIFNYNILVCALCNNACDMLASKLQNYVDKSKMIRLYAASRSWKSVPDDIKRGNTNFSGGELYMPEEEELMKYRIIICTFVTAGRIASMKFPSGHFQRIFIDE